MRISLALALFRGALLRGALLRGALLRGAAFLGAAFLGVAAAPAVAQHMPPANPNYTPAPPKEGYSYPDCYCTDSEGKRIEVGQLACLRIGGREVWALCDWSVNVTTWRYREGESCPTS